MPQDRSRLGRDAPYELWYSSQEGEHERNHLTIRPDGSVSGRILHARAGAPIPVLGFFFIQPGVNDPDLVEIGRLIGENGLHGGKTFNVMRAPGLYAKVFQIEMQGVKTQHYLSSRDPLPEPLVPLDAKLRELMSRLAEGPLSTLALELELEPSAVRPGDETRIAVTFRNPGRFDTWFRCPAAFGGGSDTFQINFWTKRDAGAGGVRDQFEWTLDLVGRELRTAARAVSSSDRHLLLPAGRSIRMWTTERFPRTAAGSYEAELVYYASPAGEEESNQSVLIVGEYHAAPFPLRVEL